MVLSEKYRAILANLLKPLLSVKKAHVIKEQADSNKDMKMRAASCKTGHQTELSEKYRRRTWAAC
ncbi:hypothetical protein GCM10011403_13230 [Pseudohongiella nitratireducens]|uniref:Uncharacterized protein n=1 Tax=Pseudohongiella nitratireducens TaxID=1768907 RepID=A0A917GVE0_9GAMM|nr:hypothetical protein GCM10011403_13230 [Pseudohongiella nitratireducens]